MTNREFLTNLFFRHDPVGIIYRDSKDMINEYAPEARHVAKQLELGIPFKTAIHDVFSFFFRSGELIPKAELVARMESEYYNFITKNVV